MADAQHTFISALERQHALCPAACGCARAGHDAIGNVSLTSSCHPPTDVRSYLSAVYPVAAGRFSAMEASELAEFFHSLHFYYDFGCDRHANLAACSEPGVMLRWLYNGLLPCRQSVAKGAHHPSLGACVNAHYAFSPAWAQQLLAHGYAEVEHRAVGFGVYRASTAQQLSGLFNEHTGEPSSASAFMDAGVASMWYTFRRGSGIFYRLGRTMSAPGKTAMVAKLLRELSSRPALAAAWPAVASYSNLFPVSAPSGGALADSERIRSVANGSASCPERRVQPCRCRYVLHDAWDDALVWIARALKYETLFFTATLLCNQPAADSGASPTAKRSSGGGGGGGGGSSSSSGGGSSSGSEGSGGSGGSSGGGSGRLFATAYPELVDVRPLDAAMVDEQARGVHAYLQPVLNATDAAELRTMRKRHDVAEAWIHKMRGQGLLSLRDPIEPQAASSSRCDFSVHRLTMQCDGHISSRWQRSAWSRCGIIGCGYVSRNGPHR